MIASILSYLTGRAAKAGMGLLGGALSGIAGMGAVDLTSDATSMSVWGYIIIGAITGLSNWAAVYFKRAA